MILSEIISEGKRKPIVISSSGKNFSLGYDCSCHLVKDNDFLLSVVSLGSGIAHLITNYDSPVVSYCSGLTLGAGLELAILSDYVVSSEDVEFGFPEIKFGFPFIMIPPNSLKNFISKSAISNLLIGELTGCESSLNMGISNKTGNKVEAEIVAQQLNHNFFSQIKNSISIEKESIKNYLNYIGTMNTKEIKLKELENYRKSL
jgi:enoyl-CoA hydratase/carnithine racemase